ncbi:hypothetical protein IE53DRAFT_388751 [Violaceomyces palustris]|uniref:Uncharacterized protein n=1 Tax=Violaceomyces palustris TaxID=1673888 RepID=A0ACD0NTG5_9BASI|nr:hypothetical protein IE53DRAFT_388751 [Violaceomyces palustris]
MSKRSKTKIQDRTWNDLARERPLPIRFVLLPSRRTSKSLCPAFQVDLGGFKVTRILDPEHRQPFVSLGAILLASGLGLVTGLLELRLDRAEGDYDTSLAGLEPWDEIWSPLHVARSVSIRLGFGSKLSGLLESVSAQAWSLDEGSQGLTHNWIIPPSFLDPGLYSTASLLAASVPRVQLLPRGQLVKTLVSPQQRSEALSKGPSSSSSSSSSFPSSFPAGEDPSPPSSSDPVARSSIQRLVLSHEQTLTRWSVKIYEALDSISKLGDLSEKAGASRSEGVEEEEGEERTEPADGPGRGVDPGVFVDESLLYDLPDQVSVVFLLQSMIQTHSTCSSGQGEALGNEDGNVESDWQHRQQQQVVLHHPDFVLTRQEAELGRTSRRRVSGGGQVGKGGNDDRLDRLLVEIKLKAAMVQCLTDLHVSFKRRPNLGPYLGNVLQDPPEEPRAVESVSDTLKAMEERINERVKSESNQLSKRLGEAATVELMRSSLERLERGLEILEAKLTTSDGLVGQTDQAGTLEGRSFRVTKPGPNLSLLETMLIIAISLAFTIWFGPDP